MFIKDLNLKFTKIEVLLLNSYVMYSEGYDLKQTSSLKH